MERTMHKDIPGLVLTAVLYTCGFWCTELFIELPGDVTPVWPSAGIGFAAVLLYNERAALAIVPGVFFGHLLFSPTTPLYFAFSLSANLFAPLFAAFCVRRLGPADPLAVRVRNTVVLLLGACWLAIVSTLLGCFGLLITGQKSLNELSNSALLWWVGDFFGAMICTPAMVSVVRTFRRYREGDKRVLRAPRPEIYWWVLSFLVLAAMSWWIGRNARNMLFLSNLPLALFLWSAFRFPPVYTYVSVALALLAILVLVGVGLPGLPIPSSASDTTVLMLFFSSMAILPQLATAANFERQYFESKLIYRANHDRLTGLRNRSAFEEHAADVLIDAVRSGEPVAMAYLDLDQFKVVNDTCGHLVGDHLIRQIATVLEEHLVAGDIVARMGGDEFAVLFRNCTAEQAELRAEKLRHEVDEFRFAWRNRIFAFTISAGLVPLDPNISFNRQLSMADTACYQAKEQGRNRIKVMRIGDQDITRHHDEVEWVVRISDALASGRFRLYCQPIVPIMERNDSYNHYEVLVRMLDERGNVLLPGTFVPAAERYHMMGKVDRWVVETTFKWLHEHPEAMAKTNLCSINLSGLSLGDDAFHKFLKEQMHNYHVPPAKICFEITETAAIGDLGRANRFIKSLRKEGCSFALDDFGSGLASFGYLKTLHVDFLKIDGAFVRDIARAPVDLAMVKSINEVGHVMGKKTIAEYVESKEVSDQLRKLGVDYAQGHAVGKPVPIEEYFSLPTARLIA